MEHFKSFIAEILEVDHVNLNDELEGFESWDSLARLSIISKVEELYSVELSEKDLSNSSTIGDLHELILSKNGKNIK